MCNHQQMERNEGDHARALKADRIAQLEKVKADYLKTSEGFMKQVLKMTVGKPRW